MKHAHFDIFYIISMISCSHIRESNNNKIEPLTQPHAFIDPINVFQPLFHTQAFLVYFAKCDEASCWTKDATNAQCTHPCNCVTTVFRLASVWYAMKNQLRNCEKEVHFIGDMYCIWHVTVVNRPPCTCVWCACVWCGTVHTILCDCIARNVVSMANVPM